MWLSAWLPAEHGTWHCDALVQIANIGLRLDLLREESVEIERRRFSRGLVIHCPPLLLPGLSTCPPCVIQDHPVHIP